MDLTLKYGANPHQSTARASADPAPFEVLNGKPGYINLLDALNSWQLVVELAGSLATPAAASFKHVSPAGAAVGNPLTDEFREVYDVADRELSPLACAYVRARQADPMSSFGDWIALSHRVDVPTAKLIRREVSDGVCAPGYEEEALEILNKKKGGNYPILCFDPDFTPPDTEKRDIFGVTLEQSRNDVRLDESILENIVTRNRELTPEARRDLLVATITLKYTQSNSVCYALDGQVVGNGAGQQSRVHCAKLAGSKVEAWHLRRHPKVRGMAFTKGLKRPEKVNAVQRYVEGDMTPKERTAWETNFETVPEPLTAQERNEWMDTLTGVALSSDAFFPFRDSLDQASRYGVRYVVQTGGSVRDDLVVEAADEYDMVMAISGIRLFHH